MLKTSNLISQLVFFGLLGIVILLVSGNSISAQPAATKASAKFDKLWVDYDVTENGVKGMRIHTKFTAYGMKNVPSYVAVYFQTGDGERLRDTNKKFYSTSGEVAVYKELQIDYDPGVYNDLSIFMPYDELDLLPGDYDLKLDVDLIYKAGGLIQHLTFYDISYTEPEEVKNTIQKATLEKVWIDYDVMQEGKRGMLIHAKCTVRGLKGIDSYLAIYFERQNGDKLTSSNKTYASKDGQLAIYKPLKPGFEPTAYDDAQLFLPYDAIEVGNGVFNLKMDVDLIYKNGDLFQHLDYHEFVFRRAR